MKFSLNHYHVSCPDKYELAKWYEINLGFKQICDVEKLGESGGPLIISGDGGVTSIALFSSGNKNESPKTKILAAFEVSPEDFVRFVEQRLHKNLELIIYDHLVSFSVYLVDLVGSKVEIVSNRYSETKDLLEKKSLSVSRMNPVHDQKYQDLK